jgi:diguanylate cyclase (GGDEF)-like protein/PAS domain S-box-containing protein
MILEGMPFADAPEEFFRSIVADNAPDALVVIRDNGLLAFLNDETERLFGYEHDELLGQHYEVLLPHRARNEYPNSTGIGERVALLRGNDALYGLRNDGREFPIEIALAPVITAVGEVVVVSIRDATDRREHEDELREALSLVSATLESTADGILVVTAEGKIAGSNEQFARMWGIPADLVSGHDDEKLLGFVVDQLVEPSVFVEKVRELYAEPDAESLDLLEFRDGRTFERYSQPQRIAKQVVGRVWSFRDITARRSAQRQAQEALAELGRRAEQLKQLAYTDSLTGLANRVFFHERLEEALNRRESGSISVFLLDLDDFKEVNDILGHQAGDKMLVETGRRLRECVGPADTVARIGGDEFVILLIDPESAEVVADRVVNALSSPVVLDGHEVHPSVSLGLATSGSESLQASDLLRRADIAMYVAKAAGKNRYLRFRPEMMTAILKRNNIESGLHDAIEHKELVVHYQPILIVESGRAAQVESLVRWNRPDGLVPPLDFIAIAEGSGLINAIGLEVLTQSCTQLRDWLGSDNSHSVAINVSVVQLREDDFADVVLRILAEFDVDPHQLVVEVTESAYMDSEVRAIKQLRKLRDRGVRVSLDDFGTGYSSLGRLQNISVDIIKLDRTFVSGIRTGNEVFPILNSMIGMAHDLGLHVTAEGVETVHQARHLVELGCDSLQGFFFSRPVPFDLLNQAAEHATSVYREAVGATDTGESNV